MYHIFKQNKALGLAVLMRLVLYQGMREPFFGAVRRSCIMFPSAPGVLLFLTRNMVTSESARQCTICYCRPRGICFLDIFSTRKIAGNICFGMFGQQASDAKRLPVLTFRYCPSPACPVLKNYLLLPNNYLNTCFLLGIPRFRTSLLVVIEL